MRAVGICVAGQPFAPFVVFSDSIRNLSQNIEGLTAII